VLFFVALDHGPAFAADAAVGTTLGLAAIVAYTLGFVAASPLGFTAPSVRIPLPGFQVVVLPAYDPSMTGALVYADTFWAMDCVGLRGAELERFGTPVRADG